MYKTFVQEDNHLKLPFCFGRNPVTFHLLFIIVWSPKSRQPRALLTFSLYSIKQMEIFLENVFLL